MGGELWAGPDEVERFKKRARGEPLKGGRGEPLKGGKGDKGGAHLQAVAPPKRGGLGNGRCVLTASVQQQLAELPVQHRLHVQRGSKWI